MGKSVSRPKPPSDLVTTDVPQLRIVDDELWNQVTARQLEMRRLHRAAIRSDSIRRAARNISSPV